MHIFTNKKNKMTKTELPNWCVSAGCTFAMYPSLVCN